MVLEQLKEVRGLPNMIRVDNGLEFNHRLDTWFKDHKTHFTYIQPGKPTQNAYVERFNGSIRRELLDPYVFRSTKLEKRPTNGSKTTTTTVPINRWATKHQWTSYLNL